MHSSRSQTGFSVLENLLILVIVVLIGFVGWYIYHSKEATDSVYSQAAQVNNSPLPTAPKTINSWTLISSTALNLSRWNVSVRIPKNLVNNAVYKYQPDEYDFSIKQIVGSKTCADYYSNTISIPEASLRQIWRYYKTTSITGHLNPDVVSRVGESTTMDQYYASHKVAGSNYFEDSGERFYKVGNYFYFEDVIPGDLQAWPDLNKYCPNLPSGFLSYFLDTASTIK